MIHLAGTRERGILHWYRDPLPTNCVAMEFCGGRGHQGKHNLAVFYGSCVLNCLYCQNWHFRDMLPTAQEIRSTQGNRQEDIAPSLAGRSMGAAELASVANARTHCVCYFGGDPASQMPHALASAALLAQRGVAVCWETSGNANPRLMERAVQLALQSGGTVKFDLKAFDDGLHWALTGSSNRQTLENFARAATKVEERPSPPLLVASTLLVPGYVDVQEVANIAQFIAGFDSDIPYALLGFAPGFFFSDLPCTSVRHAEKAQQAAQAAGLTNVRIGNRHLLSRDY
jgi:pyruvate formate lyase activating enzyme